MLDAPSQWHGQGVRRWKAGFLSNRPRPSATGHPEAEAQVLRVIQGISVTPKTGLRPTWP